MIVPEAFNLADYFVARHVREGRGDKTAIRCGQQQVSYAELHDLVKRCGAGLSALGVGRGDRVLLLLPDSVEFAAAFFGAASIGAVAVPANTSLRAEDFAYFLDESGAKILLANSALQPKLDAVLERVLAIFTGNRVDGCRFWPEWISSQIPESIDSVTTKDDPAFWLWTSGSTGFPKAAVHRHQDWMHSAENYAVAVLGIGPGDVTFSTAKLFHAYGLGNGLMFPFYVGATTVLFPGRPTATAILDTVQSIQPTLFFSVPTLYAAMLEATDQENPYRFPGVRLAASAAEPLPAEIFRRWKERFGFDILDGIGSTEVLHIYVSARMGSIKPGSTGQPVPGYEIRITDLRGEPVERGKVGDLWVRGAGIATHYWNRPELTAERMRDGWFFTGDKYFEDAEGYLFYAGRSDDMFRAFGEWISPIEIEGALISHPAVLECAVVPREDEHQLLRPMAYVVLKSGRTAGAALAGELQTFVKQRCASYKCPRQIEFLGELPKTATGKVQRYKLRELSARVHP